MYLLTTVDIDKRLKEIGQYDRATDELTINNKIRWIGKY